MIAYHVTKRRKDLEAILTSKTLLAGRNVNSTEPLVHLALKPFVPGRQALHSIGPATLASNEAWILELRISNETKLEKDPCSDDEQRIYAGCLDSWVVCKGPLAIQVVEVMHIPNVDAWEMRMTLEEYAEWRSVSDAETEKWEALMSNLLGVKEYWPTMNKFLDLVDGLEKYSHLAR
jgi:hypothetical protein